MLPIPLGVLNRMSFALSPSVDIVGNAAVYILSAESRKAASSKTRTETLGIPRAARGVAGKK